MKKVLICFFLLTGIAISSSMAQSISSGDNQNKNIVKFNALTLIGGKFSFEYERQVMSQLSVAGSISFRPKAGLPFKSSIKDILDDEEFNASIDGFKTSNFSLTPEVRFYTSSKGSLRGFYIAPFLKYASFNAQMPFDFEVDNEGGPSQTTKEVIPLKGTVSTFNAGLAIGVNFKLTEKVYLDWRIIGPGYGASNGTIEGKKTLDADEQQALKDELNNFKADLEDLAVSIKIDPTVNSEGAKVKVKGPWATIRSGLSIGYRF